MKSLSILLKPDKYETALYFFYWTKTWLAIVSWFLSFYLNLPVLNLKLFCFDAQKVFRFRSGTNTKINKQLHIKFWFDRKISENSWTDLTLLNAGPGRVVVVERFCTMILPLITEKKQTVKIFFFNVIPSRFFHTKQVLLHHTWMYLILIFWVFTKRMIP